MRSKDHGENYTAVKPLLARHFLFRIMNSNGEQQQNNGLILF